MIGLLQRVSRAAVTINHRVIAEIGTGLAVLVAVQRHDTAVQANRLLERLLTYRVFEDEQGRMNLDLKQVGGGLLLVPQFTLAANTRKGTRPSFTAAADPAYGESLYEELVDAAKSRWHNVASGVFGANMNVSLVNQGPVTFWLEVRPGVPPPEHDGQTGNSPSE
jgi:D-tyrosyl-tRNA(Tyr) deacylase